MGRVRAFTAIVALLAGVAAGCGLVRHRDAEGVAAEREPLPLPQLVGQSRAGIIRHPLQLLPGPGAEGRPGDLFIENAFVRFVVAAQDHLYPGTASGGNLLDAAVQEGQDRLRLLVPRLGPEGRGLPVYNRVQVVAPGGKGRPAAICAEGYYSENPGVLVRTCYELRPDAKSLRITTHVENQTSSALLGFCLADRIYHGRTLRFAEGQGLYPRGKGGRTDWLSFFYGGSVWGLYSASRRRMESVHGTGWSQLTYCQQSFAPGERHTYSRYLYADYGDPSTVCEAMLGGLSGLDLSSRLRCQVVEQGTCEPVEGAYIEIRTGPQTAASLLITGRSGTATCRLPAGKYLLGYSASGRPGSGAMLPLELMSERETMLKLKMAAQCSAAVEVREPVQGRMCSMPARITLYGPGKWPAASGPSFYESGRGSVALTGRSGDVVIPLSPASAGTSGLYGLAASRGPLYNCEVQPVWAWPGRQEKVRFALKRAVDPGDYVAVDLRQYADFSPDCALTIQERLLSNECEGLDAAVLCTPPEQRPLLPLSDGSAPALMASLEVNSARWGCFSVIPLRSTRQEPHRALPLTQVMNAAPGDLFRLLRAYFPAALIQVNCPLDRECGYFRRAGFAPDAGESAGDDFCWHFDAVEVLSGRDVTAARKVLHCWFRLLNEGKKVLATGGSGSRALLWEEAGVARTYVHCPRKSSYPTGEEIREAIAKLRDRPNAFVTNGPFLRVTVNGMPIGSQQTATDGTVEMCVRVYAPRWVQVKTVTVYRNGEVAASFEVPSPEGPLVFDRAVRLDARSDCWFVVAVEGEQGMWPAYCGQGASAVIPFAVTNPFWIDADGDGVISLIR